MNSTRALLAPGPQDALQVTSFGANELAHAALAGDRTAEGKLLRVLAPELRRVCRAVFGSRSTEVEDTLQDALVAFARALPSFRFEADVRHYAVRVALRTAIRARRRSRKHDKRFESLATLAEVTARGPLPSDEAMAALRRAALQSLLDRLPEEQAEALILYVVLGNSLDETASSMGVSPNTVKTRLRLGKNQLRRRIARDPVLRRLLGEPP